MSNPFDNIPDDPLEAALNNARKGETAAPGKDMPENYQPPQYLEPCRACGGSGFKFGGRCFKCQGKGKLAFRTAANVRAANRDKRNTNKQAARDEWRKANAETIMWLTSANESALRQYQNDPSRPFWGFPRDMLAAIEKYVSLTDNQLLASQRMIVRAAERKVERETENKQRTEAAPEVSIARIEEAFENASHHLKWPKLTLGDFTFKPASASSKNAGAIYVTEGTQYLGKVMGGKFMATRECGTERQDRILEACKDPEGAAVAHGRLTGACACCGRPLSNPESVARGIGPICAEKYGW